MAIAGSRPDQSIEFLLRIGREIGVPSVLIPTSDDTALLVAEHADELAAWYRFPRQCPNTIRTMINKKELYYLALKLGIPTPETVFPTSLEQVRDFAESALFPVMLKGIDGTRLQARTGKKMVIAATAEELLAEYPRLEDPASPNLMLQEYIPGGDDSIWMMDGYFDQRSECRMAITGKKLHQYPTGRGATSLGVCLTNDPVRELTVEFARAIDYRGILDIGFRYDERDGLYKLLDPNPRIGCTFRLFVDQSGFDVARALYLDMTGQPLPQVRPLEGRKFVVEDWEVESCLDYVRDEQMTALQCMRDIRGVDEYAWFALDDPLPFCHMSVGMVGRAFGAAGRGVVHSLKPRSRSLNDLAR